VSSPFTELMASLTRQRGVLGVMVVGESDGMIVDSAVQVGVNGPVVAALAASLARRARLAAAAAGIGSIAFFRLEAERGRIFAVGFGELVLVVLAESRANVGMLRMEMLRAQESGALR
jgi:uncharacterized protein